MYSFQNVCKVEERDWEPLLYAKVYKNFRDLHYLQQYERASVIGIVCSVSKFLVKK